MRSGLIVLGFAAALAACLSDSAEQPQAPKGRPGWLLPGYQLETANGPVIDFVSGRIWKEGGPDISYLLSLTARERARVYAEEHPKASLSVVSSPTTGEMVVALDEENAEMVVSVDRRAHFSARNVRSRKDAVEVMLMATAGAGYTK